MGHGAAFSVFLFFSLAENSPWRLVWWIRNLDATVEEKVGGEGGRKESTGATLLVFTLDVVRGPLKKGGREILAPSKLTPTGDFGAARRKKKREFPPS